MKIVEKDYALKYRMVAVGSEFFFWIGTGLEIEGAND